MRTLAGSAVGDARLVFKWNKAHSPLKKNLELDHIGGAALYLLSDLSAASPARSTSSMPATTLSACRRPAI
jgi:enoyl-[acyl-carrier-protein] reductase (NADH)